MTLKEAYENACQSKRLLIVDGHICGRKGDARLAAYVEKNAQRQVGIGDERPGVLIVRLKPGRQEAMS